MNTRRRFIEDVYSSEKKPQRIKHLCYNEKLTLYKLLSQAYEKINEIIEVTPNNFPVLIDVYETHTGPQIRIYGTMFIDFKQVELDETLSTFFDSSVSGNYYVNVLNDCEHPRLEISSKFMEPNWTTLYLLTIENGNITNVVYNDIYAGMHESDPNAHPLLVEELQKYIDSSVDRWFSQRFREFVVWDLERDGELPVQDIVSDSGGSNFMAALINLNSVIPEIDKWTLIRVYFESGEGYNLEVMVNYTTIPLDYSLRYGVVNGVSLIKSNVTEEGTNMIELPSIDVLANGGGDRLGFRANYNYYNLPISGAINTSRYDWVKQEGTTTSTGPGSEIPKEKFLLPRRIVMTGYSWELEGR